MQKHIKLPVLVAVLLGGFVFYGVLPREGCACTSTIEFARRGAAGLVEAQEMARTLLGTYAGSVAVLDSLGLSRSTFTPYTIQVATATGWSALVQRDGEGWACALFMGDVTPPEPAREPGALRCAGTAPFQRWWYAFRH